MYPNRTQALAGLLGLALACPLSIHAQTTSADPIDETDEARTDEDQMALPRVYVRGAQGGRHYGITGTKTGTPLIETPQSVSVITEEQIRKQGVDDLAQALRYAPGVSGEPFGFEPRTTFIRLRGFDATTTGLYRDGLQLQAVAVKPGGGGVETAQTDEGGARLEAERLAAHARRVAQRLGQVVDALLADLFLGNHGYRLRRLDQRRAGLGAGNAVMAPALGAAHIDAWQGHLVFVGPGFIGLVDRVGTGCLGVD